MRSEHGTSLDAAVAARLRQVYWLGGGSGAGKSTIAERIAARHGLRVYDTDRMMSEHASRGSAEDCPYLTEFIAMTMDQRWVDRTPQVMLDTFHWFRGEGFGLIVDDLLNLPAGPGVIVEGFRLLPHLVRPLLSIRTNAVWLLPTPEFRLAAFDSRDTMWQIAGRTSDPRRALGNLLERERMFTERLDAETTRLDLPVIRVGTEMTEDALTARVTAAFGL